MVPIHSVIIPLNVLMNRMNLIGTRLSLIYCVRCFKFLFVDFLLSPLFMKQIPMEFEEAATIDGCSKLQMFLRIVLPMCRSALATAGTLAFINCWNDLLLSMIFVSKSEWNTLNYSIFMLKAQFYR